MIGLPIFFPITNPVLLTVACVIFLQLHIPPVVELLSWVFLLEQKVVMPVIGLIGGVAYAIIDLGAELLLQ